MALKRDTTGHGIDWCSVSRLSFATDIARGMAYLHQHKVFHGRLHSRNCVIDDRWVCKISGSREWTNVSMS